MKHELDRRHFLYGLAVASAGILPLHQVFSKTKALDVGGTCPPAHFPPLPPDYMVFPHGNISDMTTAQVPVLVREATIAQESFAADMLIFGLQTLENVYHGFQINQLEHSLQSATRAYRDNATDEWVFAALCHDMAKIYSPLNHDATAGELIRSYVSDEVYSVIKNHQLFEGRHYYGVMYEVLKSPEWNPGQYKKFSNEPWFQKAMNFSDNWDSPCVEIHYDSKPLSDFTDLIRKMVLKPIP